VIIVGAGPAGLTAAYSLLRHGHACTLLDRHGRAGGTLRSLDQQLLPPAVLEAEIRFLAQLGAQFRFEVELGRGVQLGQLLRESDAVLLTLGEISKAEGEALGLTMAPGGIKIHPDTFQTDHSAVFAAGRALRPLNHLIRAMSDGQTAAECLHHYLLGKKIRRPDKPFSSVMGRVEKHELERMLQTASPTPGVTACDACAGLTQREAATEAARCLHCDCRSAGDCALQSYARLYHADPNRFRHQRRGFEQFIQPGGVIFEPGKCILCGICVRLTELAKEPLGLTFIGRGFDVRIAAPFNRTIEEGLQKVAEECVRHCPTGALVLSEKRTPERNRSASC
jgi:ferredoxin